MAGGRVRVPSNQHWLPTHTRWFVQGWLHVVWLSSWPRAACGRKKKECDLPPISHHHVSISENMCVNILAVYLCNKTPLFLSASAFFLFNPAVSMDQELHWNKHECTTLNLCIHERFLLFILAGTQGTWWTRETASSISWSCAGVKATAGEPHSTAVEPVPAASVHDTQDTSHSR